MKKLIIIHATGTPADEKLTLERIEEINSQERNSDPMPFHYVVNTDGRILKGRSDKEICGHCGRYSRDSLSVAYAGGIDPETEEETDTLSETQGEALKMILRNLTVRHPDARVVGANELLHPDDAREDYEPYFDVGGWLLAVSH